MQWWIDLLSPFAAGLAGATAIGFLVRALFPPPPQRQGWHRIAPSAMHWIGVVGSGGVVSLLLYVRFFVGSARTDAEYQMQVLTWLILAFALCLVIGVAAIRTIVRHDVWWRGTTLDYAGPDAARITKDLTQVVGMQRRWSGRIWIAFADGDVLKLDGYASTVDELCARIVETDERLAAGLPL